MFLCALTQAAENANKTEQSINISNKNSLSPENLPGEKTSKASSEWGQFVPPANMKFDWLQLTSGEWLKGELKAL